MGLESATYINDLVNTNPVGASDTADTLDDHIRLIKSVLLNHFPNFAGVPISLTEAQLNKAVYLDLTTYLLFYNSAAPTGWTRNTALANLNGCTLRVITGAWGGTVGGTHNLESPPSTSHTHTMSGTTGSHVLTAAEIPVHTHSLPNFTNPSDHSGGYAYIEASSSGAVETGHNTGAVGSGTGHTHTVGTLATASTGPTAFSPKFINTILCYKSS